MRFGSASCYSWRLFSCTSRSDEDILSEEKNGVHDCGYLKFIDVLKSCTLNKNGTSEARTSSRGSQISEYAEKVSTKDACVVLLQIHQRNTISFDTSAIYWWRVCSSMSESSYVSWLDASTRQRESFHYISAFTSLNRWIKAFLDFQTNLAYSNSRLHVSRECLMEKHICYGKRSLIRTNRWCSSDIERDGCRKDEWRSQKAAVKMRVLFHWKSTFSKEFTGITYRQVYLCACWYTILVVLSFALVCQQYGGRLSIANEV